MARETFVEIRGLEEVIKRLEKLPGDIQAKILETALREGAVPVERVMKDKCPVDEGETQRSISIRKLSRGKGIIRIGVGPNPAKVHPKNKPIWLEYGTKRGGKKKVGQRRFMRPAYDETKEESKRRVASSLEKQLPGVVDKT